MIEGPGILPASGNAAKKLVVLFHGYGSCGNDLLNIASSWTNLLPEAEFIAPNGIEKWEGYASGYQWFGLQERTPANIRARLDRTTPVIKA